MPSRSRDGKSGRVAIVGATGNEGVWLRAALEAHGVASGRVDLFGELEGEVVLSEYAGEARLVQPLAPDCLSVHDVVFLCQPAPSIRIADEALMIALGIVTDDIPLVHEPLCPVPEAANRVRVPDSLAVVLAELLAPLTRLSGVESVQAVVLRPAAGFGSEGLDELREQTVRLLRFERAPTEIFGKPLAFNLIPDPTSGGRHPSASSVASEVRHLLGKASPAISLRAATGPWFHGHVVFLHLHGLDGEDEDIRRALRGAQGIEFVESGSPLTPAEGPEDRRTIVFEVAHGGDGTWIQALAAEAETAAARQAVALAVASGRL